MNKVFHGKLPKGKKSPLTPTCTSIKRPSPTRAQMAELVDALASGASVRMDVEVRVLFWAPFIPNIDLHKRTK